MQGPYHHCARNQLRRVGMIRSSGLYKNKLSRYLGFSLVRLICKINIIIAKIRIMAYQMSIISPRAPYSRVPSNLSVETATDAIQDPLVPQGNSQPQHRVPHSRFVLKPRLRWLYIDFRFYLKPFLRCLGTFAFTASIYGTLRNYERKDNFSPKYKTFFNGITTALILGLGLNLFVSRSSAPSTARGH